MMRAPTVLSLVALASVAADPLRPLDPVRTVAQHVTRTAGQWEAEALAHAASSKPAWLRELSKPTRQLVRVADREVALILPRELVS